MSKDFDIAFKLGAELTSSFKGAFAEANKSMRGLEEAGKRVKSLGKTMTTAVTTPIVGLGAAAVMVGANFEQGMSNVAAVSGAGGEELEKLTAKARELGATTQFSATEASEALNFMAMAGWDTNQMLGGIDGVMSAAAASGEDLATVSDIITDSITAFGMKAEDSTRFADVLAAASSNANTNISMLGESFKYVAPLAGAMGYSAEDASVALSLMANAGIKGSQSGTALKTMLANLSSPTKSMKDAMDSLGISLTNSDGSMKSLDEVMLNLRASFSDLDEVQQASAASTIFGKEAMAGALAVINATEEDYDKLTGAINNSAGAADEMAAIVNDNLIGRFKEMQSAMEEAGITIYQNLKPALESGVATITGLVGKFNDLDPAAQNTIVVIAGVVASIGPLLVVVGVFIEKTVTVIRTVKALNRVYRDMNLIQRTVSATMNTLRASALAMSISGQNLRATLTMMIGRMKLLNLTMLANPFVIAAVAIIALGAAFVLAYKHSETFRNVVHQTFAFVENTVASAAEWIKNVSILIWENLVSGIFGIGEKIKQALSSELVLAFGSLAEQVKENFLISISTIPGIISRVAPMFTTALLGVLGVGGPLGIIIGIIVSLASFLYRLAQTNEEVGEAFRRIWESVSEAFAPIVEVLADGFNQIVEEVGPELVKTMEVIEESFLELGPPLAELGQTFAELGVVIVGLLAESLAEIVPVIEEVVSFAVELGPVIATTIGMIAKALAIIIPIILHLISEILPVLLELWMTVFSAVLEIVLAVLPIIVELFVGLITVVLDLVMTVLPLILSVIELVFPLILEIIQMVLPIFVGLLTSIVGVILNLVQMVIPALLEIIQLVFPIILEVIQMIIPIITMILEGLIMIINGVLIPAINGILAVVQFVFPFIQLIIETALEIINGIIQAAMALLQGDWEGAWEAIKATAENIMNNIISFFSGIDLFSVGKAIIDGLINGIKSMGGAVVGAITDMIPAPIRGAASKVLGAIPGFADGGFVSSPTLAWVGEGGDTEAIIPLNNAARSQRLWFETGQALGMFDDDDTEEPSGGIGDIDFKNVGPRKNGSDGNTIIDFRPVYHIDGGNPSEVVEVVEQSNDDLREQLKEIKDDDERRRF